MKKLILLISIISILLTACSPQDTTPSPMPEEPIDGLPIEEPVDETKEEVDEIQEKLESMTLEEKIGQLMIVGFEGTQLNENTRSFIEDLKVGGLVFFGRNIETRDQVVSLVEEIKGLNQGDIPLFLAVDEEGGLVSRVPKEYKRLPDSIKIGDLDDDDLAFQYGQLLGNRVRSLGLNLDFAPVMDIHSNPNNPVIGNRAYGTTPDRVTKIGLQVAAGLRDRAVIPSIKHFPGHGDTSTDSHIELPVIGKSLQELRDFELIPFKAAVGEDIEMVMVAHILLPSIDDEFPATLSSKVIADLLRGDLGYDGVIITDDMTMGAIVNNYSLEEASIKFLKAGGDILLICHGEENPSLVFNRIMQALEDGELSMEEIDKKVYRILELKKTYLTDENLQENPYDIQLEDLNIQAQEIIDRIR